MAQDDGFIITEILDIFSGAEEAVGKTPDEPADIALEEEPSYADNLALPWLYP